MFRLTLGEEVKFKIPVADKGQIYRVILSYEFEGVYEAKANINYYPICGKEL